MTIKIQSFLLIIALFSVGCVTASTNNSGRENITLCKQGWSETQSGSHFLAIDSFNECIKNGNLSTKSLAKTYRNIGIANSRIGNFELAISYYDKALALSPLDPWNDYINRGNAWDELNKFDNAIKDYNLALKIRPNYGEAFYNKGISYEKQKKIKAAIIEFTNAYNSGLRTKALLERLQVHNQLKNIGTTEAKKDSLTPFIQKMFQQHEGKTLCSVPETSFASIRSSLLSYLAENKSNQKVSGTTVATALWTLYPCPFSPNRTELEPATLKDIKGVWVFPESSQKLRFGPNSNQKAPTAPLPVKCEAIAYYPNGEMRNAIFAGQQKCPFEKAIDMDAARKNPIVANWSLLQDGRVCITRSDVKNHTEEWDLYSVVTTFSTNGVQFEKGDLLAYLRKENGNKVNAATQFRHLKRLQ